MANEFEDINNILNNVYENSPRKETPKNSCPINLDSGLEKYMHKLKNVVSFRKLVFKDAKTEGWYSENELNTRFWTDINGNDSKKKTELAGLAQIVDDKDKKETALGCGCLTLIAGVGLYVLYNLFT